MSKSKPRTRTKILGDVYLQAFVGEQDVFVKVAAPDEIELEPQEKQEHIRKFYRWAKAKFGLDPSDVWNAKLRWAVIPLRAFGDLIDDFNVQVVSEKEFYTEEG